MKSQVSGVEPTLGPMLLMLNVRQKYTLPDASFSQTMG